MRINANWKVAMSLLVAFCLAMMQLEPGAFAKSKESSSPVSAIQNQDPAPPPATPQATARPDQDQTKARPKRRRLKWLLIGAAAVGGVVAAILLSNKKKAEPVVTIGGPTVGNPQ
jgi:hypothetical protein